MSPHELRVKRGCCLLSTSHVSRETGGGRVHSTRRVSVQVIDKGQSLVPSWDGTYKNENPQSFILLLPLTMLGLLRRVQKE